VSEILACQPWLLTAHPSAILRAPDAASRARGRDQLVADLALAARAARKAAAAT
jgi:hypothetical protein